MRSLVITGISGTLGTALTKYFITNNWQVIGSVRNRGAEDAVRQHFASEIDCGSLVIVQLDGASPEYSAKNLASVLPSVSPPLALINNAATDSSDTVIELTQKEIIDVLNVNMIMPALLSAAVIAFWRERNISGVLLHISSLLAQFGAAKSSIYAASKAGIEALSRCIAVEQGAFGIRSNVLRIGACGHKLIFNRKSPNNRRLVTANRSTIPKDIPLRRQGIITEYCDAASYLVGPSSSFITGQILTVDGGVTAVYPNYTPPAESL
jgi:NAD(P)-dependent dehydrogenase (short-subunit alcohol dehydrogenase family)